jgi:hypothetical protein
MKAMKKILLALLVVSAVSLILPSETQARGGHKKNTPKKNKPKGNSGGGNSAPIDGGLSILLAAGIGLGAKAIHDKNKKKITNTDAI